jgi:hypothetical protein
LCGAAGHSPTPPLDRSVPPAQPADALPLGERRHLQCHRPPALASDEGPRRRPGDDLDQVVAAEQPRQGGVGAVAERLQFGEHGAGVTERQPLPLAFRDPPPAEPTRGQEHAEARLVPRRAGHRDQIRQVAARLVDHAVQEGGDRADPPLLARQACINDVLPRLTEGRTMCSLFPHGVGTGLAAVGVGSELLTAPRLWQLDD